MFEAGKGFAPTGEGTPQGGVISPCLLNVALHGLEEAAGVRYRAAARAPGRRGGSPVAVRYADDVVVLCHSQAAGRTGQGAARGWLAPRGLAFNEDKTRIVHLSEGFDFLGFNVRRYPNGKLLIKPSKAAIRRVRERLASELRTLRGGNAMAVIATLNPIIRGWAAYYRGVVSSRLFSSLDRLPVEAHLQVGHMAPREQAEALDRRPVLRQVQQVQERPLGIRRPRHRRLHGQVLLDGHRTARAGQGRGIPR